MPEMLLNEALTRALPVLRLLGQHGYEAVFVGGCVRDTVTGRPLKDVDIATSAAPEQVIAVFPRTIPTGLKHGTVTVIHEGLTYEVTTYRTESVYESFRRPVQVQFVTELEADLLRRDFTINAMAMRTDGTIVDPFGGKEDLRKGLLRCVGDADARFQEDALRMVRAVRFAAEFGMRISVSTWRALKRHQGLLAHVAMERVGAECDKMISGASPQRAAAWMAASGLLKHTKQPLPDAVVRAAEKKEWKLYSKSVLKVQAQRSYAGIDNLSETDDRWAALCLALAMTEEESDELFGAMRFAAVRSAHIRAVVRLQCRMREAVCSYLTYRIADEQLHRAWIDGVLQAGIAAAASWLRTLGAVPSLPVQDMMERADDSIEEPIVDLLDKLASGLRSMPVSSVKELAIGGADVLRLLRKPSGPWLGQLLNEMLRAVAFGEVPNDRDRLLQFASARHKPD